ncbi:RNA helicase [Bordetella trematum]|uniref:DEAD/DEAH box helicase n=3 Tax=Bordetella trematum TaxID=123899 RepID=UPI0004707F53|nr:DEAD/DEAH box helicase [Bordetella trematum]AUL45696.1 RNA helicase [Bordetella trematum]AZR92490.1 RNA helicase [Bordetella trematum]NNH20257.1 DEAD/DEAH box helicase [Bordetella trematum]SAI56609.1 ATP-dependent RNA helicase [Bordetella trematum]SAI61130.1 ATP-dependent RNA helicase [Bordetella trematum]
MSFADLGLVPSILSAVESAGFTEPTPVQAAAIPRALAGQDLMVSSQTGSGKTAAFMLPALNRIAGQSANRGVGVQVLVLTPTRELAMQVSDATTAYGANLPGLRTAVVVGGVPYGAQLKALSRRVDVLVATPGRLIDHLKAGRVKLNTVHTLVLDEADRMLDMGFIEDIETIIERLPNSRQTLLFSATLDGSVARLAEKMMREPERIEIAGHRDKHTNITQTLLYADDASHKMRLLDHLLRDTRLDQAIVFTATKRGADDLADRLSEQGFSAAALHGDMNQRQRTRTLTQLQRGQVRVLVATDVAARGIDVQGISHAVNFDLPLQAEDYVHRIGRTGRAGRDGLAYTLAVHGERHKVRRIEHYIGQTINPEIIAGLEPQRLPRSSGPRTGGPRPGAGGKRFGDRPQRNYGDRPQRDFSDRPQRDFADRPQRDAGDRPQRSFSDRPQRDFGDRPQRSFGDRPQRDFGDRPQRSFGDRPQRDFGDRPQRSFGDRPQRDFGDRPQRSFGDRPQRDFGDRPQRSFGDRPQRDFGDRPQRSFGDRPQRDAGDRPQRNFGDRPQRDFGDRPQRSFGDRPQRSGGGKPFHKPAGARRG